MHPALRNGPLTGGTPNCRCIWNRDAAAEGRERLCTARCWGCSLSRTYATYYGTVTLPNAASLRLHEKFGFRPVGVFPHAGYKLGRWHDVLHLEKALGDPAEPPVPVRGIRELEPVAVAAALNGEAGLSGRREFCF